MVLAGAMHNSSTTSTPEMSAKADLDLGSFEIQNIASPLIDATS